CAAPRSHGGSDSPGRNSPSIPASTTPQCTAVRTTLPEPSSSHTAQTPNTPASRSGSDRVPPADRRPAAAAAARRAAHRSRWRRIPPRQPGRNYPDSPGPLEDTESIEDPEELESIGDPESTAGPESIEP